MFFLHYINHNAAAMTTIPRPLNAFMIFANQYRRQMASRVRAKGIKLRDRLLAFADETALHGADRVGAGPAGMPARQWVKSLAIAHTGTWASVTSVSNNVVSKMLARKWSWTKVAVPAVAATYAVAQRNAKELHERQYPAYKYTPAPPSKTLRRRRRRCRGAVQPPPPALVAVVETPRVDPELAGKHWVDINIADNRHVYF